MFAYWLPAAGVPMEAAEHPSAQRLLPAGPWQYSVHPQGGTLASWKDPAGRAPRLDDFGPGRPTADGLTYYPPKVPATLGDLLRKSLPPSTPVTLACGQVLPIALAASSPRKLVFNPGGTCSGGDYLTEYARLADELRMRAKVEDVIGGADPLLGRVVLLAIQQSLRATEEVLTDLGLVSSVDFTPIVLAAWGYDPDPNADGAGAGASPSPAPG